MCPPSPCLTYPNLPTPPSFPWGGCDNGAPGLSLFRCSVSGPHRGGQGPRRWPGPSKRTPPYRRWESPSPTAAFGPQDVHLRGHFPDGRTSQPSACPFPRPVLLVASASPPPQLVSVLGVLRVHSLAWHGCYTAALCRDSIARIYTVALHRNYMARPSEGYSNSAGAGSRTKGPWILPKTCPKGMGAGVENGAEQGRGGDGGGVGSQRAGHGIRKKWGRHTNLQPEAPLPSQCTSCHRATFASAPASQSMLGWQGGGSLPRSPETPTPGAQLLAPGAQLLAPGATAGMGHSVSDTPSPSDPPPPKRDALEGGGGYPVRRRAACWSQRASTQWHKKILVSGTIGAVRLCSDKRASELCTYREQSVKPTPCLFH